jgi:hypothetical protein
MIPDPGALFLPCSCSRPPKARGETRKRLGSRALRVADVPHLDVGSSVFTAKISQAHVSLDDQVGTTNVGPVVKKWGFDRRALERKGENK